MHKLIGTAAAMLVLGLAIMAVVLIAKRILVTYPLGIKGDRLEVAAQDCSQVSWPFGCNLQQSDALPEPKKNPRFGRRGKRLRCQSFRNC